MNFSVNNLNFGAKYNVWGKQTSAETAEAYKNASAKHIAKGSIAVQAQDYLETPSVQKRISELPKDTFVRLHTGVLDGENKREDQVLGFAPYIGFETRSISEQHKIAQYLNGQDNLKLELDETGNLDKQQINDWLYSISKFYA